MTTTKTEGAWETIECINSPTVRHENGFVECNGKFYLMQQGRHGSQAGVYENAAYIVAGCGNRGGSPELPSIERFSF